MLYVASNSNSLNLMATNRNLWIDYLRSALTVLLVAHHASLAYTTFAHFDTKTYINSSNPIVDNSKWMVWMFSRILMTFFLCL